MRIWDCRIISICWALVLLDVGCTPKHVEIEEKFTDYTNKPADAFYAEGRNIMIASQGGAATAAGIEMIQKGGNIVDAAVAVSFAISVYRPMSTGIGGGGFMLLYFADKKETIVADFRERAPRLSWETMYVKNGKAVPSLSRDGHMAIGVPGLVAGLLDIHEKYGSLPLKTVMAPAIQLAKNGFSVYDDLNESIKKRRACLDRYQASRDLFLPNGEFLKVGDLLVQSDLANTLEIIAALGRDGFYSGLIAMKIIEEVEQKNGLLTLEDLQEYAVKYRKPIRGAYKGYEIVSMPPPSSGGVHIVQMLNMMTFFNVGEWGRGDVRTIHTVAEVMRRAFADRSKYLGDPDFYNVPVSGLTDKDYAERISLDIDTEHATPSTEIKPGDPFAYEESPETTHFSIIDGQGNMIASTQTINLGFGSCVTVPGTGIVLNNEMDDFSAQPGAPNAFGLIGGKANAIRPKKTPLSSMSPTFVFKDGAPYMALGAPGGSRIITSTFLTILNVLEFNMSLRDAVFYPRFHHQWLPDTLFFSEEQKGSRLASKLKAMGHNVAFKPHYFFGSVQAVMKDPKTGKLIGVSDPRSEGQPIGL